MLYKTSAKKMLRNGGFYEEKDTILVKPGAYRHLFYFDHFPGAQSESPVSGWGIFMVLYHQLLCGAELFRSPGQCPGRCQ